MHAVILDMNPHILHIQLLTEDHAGDTTFISWITLTPSLFRIDCAIELSHCQFPIQLAFALTINKVQGQTLTYVGVNL